MALVNVAGQIDLFGQNSCSVQNRDVTFKIEEPVVDIIPIKNDFRVGVDEQDFGQFLWKTRFLWHS